MSISVLILAGGKGTRLQSVVNDRPKPMADVNGRPFLDLNLEKFKDFEIYLSLGYMKDYVTNHYKEKYNYVIEEMPLGTGGAIKKASLEIKEEYLIVINGDSFVDIDISKIKPIRGKIQMHTVYQDNCSRYGKFENRQFIEKGDSTPGYINAGIYVIDTSLLDRLSDRSSFEEFLSENPLLIEEVRHNCLFIDIGVPEDYEKAMSIFRPR